MKNRSQDKVLKNSNLTENRYSPIQKVITTDINILLNRVRINEKNDLKKKLFFLGLLLALFSFIAIFAIN